LFYKVHTPTNALFITLDKVSKFTLKLTLTCSYIYLNINQLDALNCIMSLFHDPTCFEHMCSSLGGQNCTIRPLVSSRWNKCVV